MTDKQLLRDWLKAEKEQENFSGWDFSYLTQQWENEAAPWTYETIVKKISQKE